MATWRSTLTRFARISNDGNEDIGPDVDDGGGGGGGGQSVEDGFTQKTIFNTNNLKMFDFSGYWIDKNVFFHANSNSLFMRGPHFTFFYMSRFATRVQ